jgi:Reverse transcriptase (RNA-dependent DNA polymerase)
MQGKMKEVQHPSSDSVQSNVVGELLFGDLKKTEVECINRYTHMLILRDYYSTYVHVIGLKDKTTASIVDAINMVKLFYAQHNHTVTKIIFDHEATLLSAKGKVPGVHIDAVPAGMHNRYVERGVQDLKLKKRCADEDLPYVIDKRLEVFSYQHAAACINTLPNERLGPNTCAYMLVTNTRPIPPPFKFGQAVLSHITVKNDRRIEYALYLYSSYKSSHYVFNPLSGNVLSRQHIEKALHYPAEWKLQSKPQFIPFDKPNQYIPDGKYAMQPLNTTQPTSSSQFEAAPSITTHQPIVLPMTSNVLTAPPSTSTLPSIAHLIPRMNTTTYVPTTPTPIPTVNTVNSVSTPQPTPIPTVESTSPIQPNVSPTVNVRTSPEKIVQSVPDVLRRSTRVSKPNRNIFNNDFIGKHAMFATPIYREFLKSYRISVSQAFKDPDKNRVESAKQAMVDEVKQLIEMGTLDPVTMNDIHPHDYNKIIPSFLFFKEKTKADGTFDKWKGRLVAGGHMVDTTLLNDITAYVVNPATVMLMLAIAAAKGLSVMTADVKGAFLIPELSDSPEELTYVRIDKQMSKVVAEVKPSWKKYMDRNGTFIMKLKKALYGLPIAANKWMTHLNRTLSKLGFVPVPGDKCSFIRLGDGDKVTIMLGSHVDDLIVVGKQKDLDTLAEELKKEYDINITMGSNHSYIGLDINVMSSIGKITVGQRGYRQEVIRRFMHLIGDLSSESTTAVPCGNDILINKSRGNGRERDNEPYDRLEYLSIVMSIMYLARLTRPDLLFACNMLATHSATPTYRHLRHCIKLLRYIAISDDYVIVYRIPDLKPEIYADASHITHEDGKGHGCYMVKVAGGLIYSKSFKLKMVTVSSTETEYVVLCEAAMFAEWLQGMLLAFGWDTPPILLRQDNQSTIRLAEQGPSFSRTKHLLVRRNKVLETIALGIVKVFHTPTEHMCADMGGKPVPQREILYHMDKLGAMIPIYESGKLVKVRQIRVPHIKPKIVRRPVESSTNVSQKKPIMNKVKVGEGSYSKFKRLVPNRFKKK